MRGLVISAFYTPAITLAACRNANLLPRSDSRRHFALSSRGR